MQTTIDPGFLTTNANPSSVDRGTSPSGEISTAARWIGRVMTGLPGAFLAVDGVVKFLNVPAVVEGSEKVGFHRATLPYLGAFELFAVLCLCSRRTGPFGAALLTAYFGGAVATHVQQGDSFAIMLCPILFTAVIWGGLLLRDERIRAISPFRRG